MTRQIYIKGEPRHKRTIREFIKMADEYLNRVGFSELSKIQLKGSYKVVAYRHGKERVMLALHTDPEHIILKIIFIPHDIRFVHDVLLEKIRKHKDIVVI